jgi:hypothetical protein
MEEKMLEESESKLVYKLTEIFGYFCVGLGILGGVILYGFN